MAPYAAVFKITRKGETEVIGRVGRSGASMHELINAEDVIDTTCTHTYILGIRKL